MGIDEVITTTTEAPFGFFDVIIEVLPAKVAKVCQAQFGVTPEDSMPLI
jgi:hypothetical protein